MNIRRNITFTLENRKKDGQAIVENVPIRMRLTFDANRIEFSTGYRIDVAKWDALRQRVKTGCSNKHKQTASEINAGLQSLYSDLQGIFKEFEVKGIMPTRTQVKDAFASLKKKQEADSKPEPVMFKPIKLLDAFVQECSSQNGWSWSTVQKFITVKNHLIKFDSDLTFESLDETKLTKYVSFLKDEEGLRNSSILKQVSFLKWFLRWSTRKGYCLNTAFETFKPKLRSTTKKVIFLTWEELNQMRNCVIPENKQYLERVRDVFLFCCFTGLRYSDVFNLKRNDVREDYIEVTTVKTADRLVIELNDHSRSILLKYRDVRFENNKVLPVISNQKMNEYLKELGELAGINEPITEIYYKGSERIEITMPKYALLGTHAGRRTFICNALALGIPAQVIMKWTGHSDYKAMRPYIDIADDVKANAMSKFNQL